jgi:hypothetical protein
MSDRPPIIDHPTDQQPPAMNRESSITVKHEDLRESERRETSPLSPEVLLLHKTRTVTNLMAQYT